jgi:hypothetical protein
MRGTLWLALSEYVVHYQSERNHQGKDNVGLCNVAKDSAGCCIIIVKKPRNLAEKYPVAGGRLHLWKDSYAAGKRTGVTEHCLRGRLVEPRRAGQQSTRFNSLNQSLGSIFWTYEENSCPRLFASWQPKSTQASALAEYFSQFLPRRLTQEFHDHHGIAQATLRVHLDNNSCLEVTVLKGKSSEVRAFADRVIAERACVMVISPSCPRATGRISMIAIAIIATITLLAASKNVISQIGKIVHAGVSDTSPAMQKDDRRNFGPHAERQLKAAPRPWSSFHSNRPGRRDN